ncbi:hypothetical protein FALBO_7848, partial [Fusarium albosuccineum]
ITALPRCVSLNPKVKAWSIVNFLGRQPFFSLSRTNSPRPEPQPGHCCRSSQSAPLRDSLPSLLLDAAAGPSPQRLFLLTAAESSPVHDASAAPLASATFTSDPTSLGRVKPPRAP